MVKLLHKFLSFRESRILQQFEQPSRQICSRTSNVVAFCTSEMFSILQRAQYRRVYAVIAALVGLRDRDTAYRHTSCEDADMGARDVKAGHAADRTRLCDRRRLVDALF
jgi:hypothetical protein